MGWSASSPPLVLPAELADLIAFNIAQSQEEQLSRYDQKNLLMAQQKGPLTDPAYLKALDTSQTRTRAAIEKNQLAAMVSAGLSKSTAGAGRPTGGSAMARPSTRGTKGRSLAVAVQSLFFFHPLVWLAAREWQVAQESACDELAIRLARVSPADYGALLVSVAARHAVRARERWVSVGVLETYQTLTRRRES